jgi:rare lipoprotein A
MRSMITKTAIFASICALSALTGCGASATHRGTLSATRASVQPGTTEGGYASYYSDSLAGETTANGESYDPSELTAAHRTLPFGTHVRVRRVDTGREVSVRINDRGPFAGRSRVIDLSRAAATALQMLRAGVVEVELEVLSVPQARRRSASR